MSGGVRNLRAMFETKDTSTSPPDRGRSPDGSIGGASSGASPRPLSKVRTSFVTVERSGQSGNQLGLKRESSHEPSMTKRRPSFSIDEEDNSKGSAGGKVSTATEITTRKNDSVVEKTIPENDVKTRNPGMDKRLDAGKERGRGPTRSPPAILEEMAPTVGGSSSSIPMDETSKTVLSKSADKSKNTKLAPKPAPISTTKVSTTAKISPNKAKTPIPKTPTTPKNHPKRSPERKPEKKSSMPSLATSQTSKPSSKPTTTVAHGSAPKTRIGASPPQTGFHKPRPRSPTKPVKLPASLTAHTASSGSKTSSGQPPPSTASGRRSLSRASASSQPTNLPASARSPSRAAATSLKSTTNRNPASNTSSGRPSLGPPPSQLKKQPSRQSLPSHTATADDSFLTRMMRPTTASASKTADKPPTTPPKRVQLTKKPAAHDGASRPEVLRHVKPEAKKEPAVLHRTKEKDKPSSKAIKKEVEAAPKAADLATAVQAKEGMKSVVQEDSAKESAAVDTHKIPELTEASFGNDEVAAGSEEAAINDQGSVEEAKVTDHVMQPSELADIKEEVALATPALTKDDSEANNEPEFEETPAEDVVVGEEATVLEPTKVEALVDAEPAVEPALDSSTPVLEEPGHVSKDEAVVPEVTQPKTAEVKSEPEPGALLSPTLSDRSEDPEDIKAREEIAKLNQELLNREGGTAGGPLEEESNGRAA